MNRELHEHQKLAEAQLRESLRSGHRRPIIQSPTGSGKTVLAAAIVEKALAKGKRVIFTVPKLSLIDQTVERFNEEGIRAIGVIQGYHPGTDGTQPVQVASIQTLRRRKLPEADLVLVDEAHEVHDFYRDWMEKPEWKQIPFVGLTATPWTRGIGKLYDDLIIPTTTAELIEKGFLSKFKVFAPSHPDLAGVKTVAGDYHEGQLSEVMSEAKLTADVVQTWLDKGEDRPTLAFCVDLAHARKLAEEFNSRGVVCGYVDAYTDRRARNELGEAFRARQVQVICSVGTLTTGIDWDVRCIILARPTKSEILYVQIIGRGLRTGVGKDHCLILDHSDTTLKLGFVTDIHHGELDDGKANRSSKASVAEEKKPRECPACKALKNTHVCPSCGFAPQRQSQLKVRDGELVELDYRKGKAPIGDKQSLYSGLLFYAGSRGYKKGWAAQQYRQAFGVWPRGLAEQSGSADHRAKSMDQIAANSFCERESECREYQKQLGACGGLVIQSTLELNGAG
jgi:DNA repair protein RadD